jgi:hypothetical protein
MCHTIIIILFYRCLDFDAYLCYDRKYVNSHHFIPILQCGKNINNDTWNTSCEMLEWYLCACGFICKH